MNQPLIDRLRAGFDWHPRPGARVRALEGATPVVGTVIESRERPGRPAVFSRGGQVCCWVRIGSRDAVCAALSPIEPGEGPGVLVQSQG